MKKNWVMFGLALVFGACGQHYFVNLTGAQAVRDSDGHVTVTTVHGCEAVGPSTCLAEVSKYCVRATWVTLPQGGSADAGADVGGRSVAEAEGCTAPQAAPPLLPALTLRSGSPVPAQPPTEIRFVVTGGRNELTSIPSP